jgi:hypothetical protein
MWLRNISLLGILLLFPSGPALGQDSTLISFQIEDQFGVAHTEKEFLGQVVLVIGSNRGGSKYSRQWGPALRAGMDSLGFGDEVLSLPVANVSSVPGFMKGMVRKKFPKEKEKWALVDWKGLFAKSYGFQKGACNLLVFDREGRHAYQTHVRELEENRLRAILTRIGWVAGRPDPAD